MLLQASRTENKIVIMDRIHRIKEMEIRLNRAMFWLTEMEKALDGYRLIQEDLHALEEYYGSPIWKEDFAADEAGLLPDDLKRGVLTEDGIDDVLEQNAELKLRIEKTLQEL